jgi:PAS domain S-box-containing protein
MTQAAFHLRPALDENAVLRRILEGTATETGAGFFSALVRNLADALDTYGAWVTEYLPETRRLRALAFWMGGQWVEGYEHHIAGTPCEEVIDKSTLVLFPDNIMALYPDDPDLRDVGAVSYMGVPLLDIDGTVLGHLAVLDTKPLPEQARCVAVFRIFAARAAAEMQRLRAEAEIRAREEQLGGLVDSALDAIVQLDGDCRIRLLNRAAEKVFGCVAEKVMGQPFSGFLDPEDCTKLQGLMRDLDARPSGQRYLWISGGLTAKTTAGTAFPAEATLSSYELHRGQFYSLILRNVNERMEAERKIQSLTVEAQYLREELKELLHAQDIVGQSPAILRVLRDVKQVAPTDATVLILGETGTGKELIARAIHGASPRRAKPLVRVNCAAIPAALIESEFFGHEKGAFTGATSRREGRFALADGGTIFLDEIGELPLELQAKLLRVLQEGEFEPVGSTRTHRVNVRVIAATNRNLEEASREGLFREDLYYRLNVFPITIPALRERSDDIPLLAASFIERYSLELGRTIEPLSDACIRRLRAYHWPGNVRELQNVIERAIITATGRRLNLDRALPVAAQKADTAAALDGEECGPIVRTVDEMLDLERRNILRALEKTRWKVAGDHGAAKLLGMNPSTLSSRMKALNIERQKGKRG